MDTTKVNLVRGLSPAAALGGAMVLLYGTRYGRRTTDHNLKLLAPPIEAGQYLIFESNGRHVGFVSWAHMSEASERNYLEDWHRPIEPEDWVSGDRVWIMAVYVMPTYLRPCFRIIRDELKATAKANGWPPVGHWVRDKPGKAIEKREIRYA